MTGGRARRARGAGPPHACSCQPFLAPRCHALAASAKPARRASCLDSPLNPLSAAAPPPPPPRQTPSTSCFTRSTPTAAAPAPRAAATPTRCYQGEGAGRGVAGPCRHPLMPAAPPNTLPAHAPRPAPPSPVLPPASRSWGGAGAVWDILRRADVAPLCGWLRDHADQFVHEGSRMAGGLGAPGANAMAPVLSQRFMMVQRHREVRGGGGVRGVVRLCRGSGRGPGGSRNGTASPQALGSPATVPAARPTSPCPPPGCPPPSPGPEARHWRAALDV
jgi:hypothetical protein